MSAAGTENKMQKKNPCICFILMIQLSHRCNYFAVSLVSTSHIILRVIKRYIRSNLASCGDNLSNRVNAPGNGKPKQTCCPNDGGGGGGGGVGKGW